jgi:hypothetical protein
MQDATLIYSLFILGITQSFSHCLMMCGPIVASISSNQATITKLQGKALLPYHCGRIITYASTGFVVCLLRQKIDNKLAFLLLQKIFISFSLLFFCYLLLKNNNFEQQKIITKFASKANILTTVFNYFGRYFLTNNFLQKLLQNPYSFRGFVLGLILGFLPCGLLYAAYALAISFNSASLAFVGMLIFGFTTIPPLLMSHGFATYLQKLPEFKIVANFIILFNIMLISKILFF